MEQHTASSDSVSATDTPFTQLVANVSRFSGTPAQFLVKLVQTQCEIAVADGGAVLVPDADRQVRVLVLHPALTDGATAPPAWLTESIRAAPGLLTSDGGNSQIVPVTATSAPDARVVLIPLSGGTGSRAVGAYLVCSNDPIALDRARERLELTAGLLTLYEMRLAVEARQHDLERLRAAMEVLAAINEQDRMRAAAIALCNELATRFGAERVTVGFLKGRYVRTVAISNTDRFDRKMKLVQDLESAMEECLDQDVEIMHPPPEGTGFVSRAAGELSLRHGPTAVFSLPMRHLGEIRGVVTLECPIDRPLGIEAMETLRLACELCTARLVELYEHDKWIGAKAADATRNGLAMLVGPRHTWAKLIAFAVVAFIVFLVFVKGDDRVDASFEITAVERRLVPAPFSGHLQTVEVEPGSLAEAGVTVLATLETAEMQLRLAAARAERAGYIKEADLSMREGETVKVQIAEAHLRKVEAEIRLLEHQIGRARIVAPISGTVVTGDLKRQIGAPVETGDVLFEIAPLDALRAELEVPEDRITDLIELEGDGSGATRAGTMASVSHPGDYIEFEVERINPVAEVIDQRNVFRVRVRLNETRGWLRPGMKGVAKVTVGRRPYGYLWTRKMVNWVRMKLWI